jgi:ABC-2 type transport system permease protein
MGPWRLELLRIHRTRRLIVLVATFAILGLGEPVLTYYLPEIVKNAGNGVTVIAPKPTAADGIAGFASNVGQLGTLVVAIIAATTLAFDAHPILATFYRTRLRGSLLLMLPRYLIVTATAIGALALGTLCAWYETRVLLGPVALSDVLGGLALEALWFCFVTSIVALFTSITRGVGAAVGGAIAFLLTLGLLGNLPATSSWLPTRLAGSGADLIRHSTTGEWRAIISACLATVAALWIATNRLRNREL